MKMDCTEIQNNLSAFLDGELSAGEKAEMEKHLAECGACSAEAERMRKVVGLVAGLPRVKALGDFTSRVHRAIEVEKDAVRTLEKHAKLAFTPASALFAAVAAVLIAVIVFLVISPEAERGVALRDEATGKPAMKTPMEIKKLEKGITEHDGTFEKTEGEYRTSDKSLKTGARRERMLKTKEGRMGKGGAWSGETDAEDHAAVGRTQELAEDKSRESQYENAPGGAGRPELMRKSRRAPQTATRGTTSKKEKQVAVVDAVDAKEQAPPPAKEAFDAEFSSAREEEVREIVVRADDIRTAKARIVLLASRYSGVKERVGGAAEGAGMEIPIIKDSATGEVVFFVAIEAGGVDAFQKEVAALSGTPETVAPARAAMKNATVRKKVGEKQAKEKAKKSKLVLDAGAVPEDESEESATEKPEPKAPAPAPAEETEEEKIVERAADKLAENEEMDKKADKKEDDRDLEKNRADRDTGKPEQPQTAGDAEVKPEARTAGKKAVRYVRIKIRILPLKMKK